MIALVLGSLLCFFAVRYLVRDHRAHVRRVNAAALRNHPSPQVVRDTSIEPAFRFPGVPEGWSLDRYAADGVQQIQIHLTQVARRTQNG